MPNQMNDVFKQAVEEYSDLVTRLCLTHLGNYADAEDCYQNTFLKLYKQLGKSVPDSIKAWLITVAVNECKSCLRFRYKRNCVNIDEIIIESFDKSDIELAQLVFSLPPKYRDVVYLHYLEGYSVSEIAGLLKSNENTVKTNLRRAREKLKLEMEV